MIIRLNKIYKLDSNIIKEFEEVSENLILLNIILESISLELDSRHIHKLYYFGDFPPLDISFDSETGLLREISIFIDKENISMQQNTEKIDYVNLSGYPSFTFDMLKKHEYYYDEICKFKILLYATSLIVIKSDEEVQKKIIINKELNILLNNTEDLIGFQLNYLSVNELKLLKG